MSAVGNRPMGCCAIALGLLILPTRPLKADVAPEAGARANAEAGTHPTARPQVTVELVAPAGVELAIRADEVICDGIAHQVRLAGSVLFTWQNGLELRAHRARFAFDSEPRSRPSHIFLEPLPTTPVELRLPEEVELKRVVGDRAYFDDVSPRTLRVEDGATLDWANGLQLRATHARVTLVETRPRLWGRVLIEPLPAAPAAP
jgi:hypothetical protein